MAAIIENTTFTLRPGVASRDFLAADAEVQTDFAYQQPGCVRRTTASNDAGEYLVVEVWQTAEHADQRRSEAANSSAMTKLMSLIDAESIRVSRYRTVE